MLLGWLVRAYIGALLASKNRWGADLPTDIHQCGAHGPAPTGRGFRKSWARGDRKTQTLEVDLDPGNKGMFSASVAWGHP
jgi:hypothetical protein